ncbi:MAG: hypothetical protein K9G64_05825 [Bacteroidia bacterium]|nr:hypothetical protein [Bacteroidia bacterium]
MKLLKSKYFIFLFIAFAYILCSGYLFNTGDQAEHLPQIYQKLNPQLYPNDFFLNFYNQTFTVRYYFVYLVYGLALVFGVKASCLIIYFICLYIAIVGLYELANYFYGNHLKSLLVIIFYLFLFRHFTVGGNYFQDNMLVGSSLAEAFCIWAFVYLFKNKYLFSGILCGLAALFQPLIGLHVASIIGIVLFVKLLLVKQNNISFKNVVTYALAFISIALFIFAPVFLSQLNANNSNQMEANKILFEYRGALHYLPQLFPLKDYVFTAFFVLISLVALQYFTKKDKSIFITIISVIIILCIIFTLILFFNPTNNLGKIQWYKTTVWLGIFCSILCVIIIPIKYIKTISIGIFSITLIYVSFIGFTNLKSGNIQINNKSISTQTHEWIKENTPINALFLAPPNDYSFNCEAQRSTAANYKAIVHETKYLLDWKQTMEKYYNMDFTKIERLDCLPAAVRGFNKIDFTKYPYHEIDYILVAKYPRMKANYNQNQVCYENEAYVVLKMK